MSLFSQIADRVLKRKILSVMVWDKQEPRALLVSVEKGEVKIVEEFSGTGLIEEFLSGHRSIGVIVTVASRYVISTITPEEVNPENLMEHFQENVPGGNADDFLVGYCKNAFSLARKSSVNELLRPFAAFEDQIVGVFFSPTSGVRLAAYLASSQQLEQVQVGSYLYLFDRDRLVEIEEAAPDDLYAGDERVAASHAQAYGGVIDFLSAENTDPNTEIGGRKEELVFKYLYNAVKMPVLAVVLLAFMLNTILFFVLNGKNLELTEKSSYIQQLDTRLKSLDRFIKENEALRKASDKRFSIIGDQIGHYTPSGITLSRLVINPPADRRSEDDFLTDQIIMEGVTANAQVFSNWLEILGKLQWLDRIEKQTYESVKPGAAQSKFQIIIHYHVDKLEL